MSSLHAANEDPALTKKKKHYLGPLIQSSIPTLKMVILYVLILQSYQYSFEDYFYFLE